MITFGISVGTSRTGICVLQDGALIEKRIHDYPGIWSDDKLHAILKRYAQYLHRYPITDIVIKIPPLSRHTNAMRRLIRRIEALAKEHYCTFDLITKTEIKGTLTLRTTGEIIKYAKMLYPELSARYHKGARSNHVFDKKLYEAVLAAHIYQERRKLKKLRNITTE
ncbi:hypothetical protein [Mucilaginibacter sp.]|uniref:hypothetical protein n=1 Tax=Mucilaginibacter sp. TaxID=1882438 RepID=UPI003263A2A3